ncbi:hypothetical protein V8C35DRAFT_317320 [Trichoderma chlorosporum]
MVDYAYNPLTASFCPFGMLLRRRSARHAFASSVRQKSVYCLTGSSSWNQPSGKIKKNEGSRGVPMDLDLSSISVQPRLLISEACSASLFST